MPRTSTGKVQRRKIADWISQQSRTKGLSEAGQSDSLTALIASLTSIPATRTDDNARLGEDLHLDSLGRV